MFFSNFAQRSSDYGIRGTRSVRQLDASVQASSSEDGALREAILQVVSIWLNRLSLVSGIASFFASIDSLLFSLASTSTHLGDPETPWSATDKLTTASFAGALIFHVCSAILAFIASFVLVRLQLLDADDQEADAETTSATERKAMQDPERLQPESGSTNGHRTSTSAGEQGTAKVAEARIKDTPDPTAAVLCRVTVKRMHPLSYLALPVRQRLVVTPKPATPDAILNPPIELLERCHTLAVWMSVAGFVLGVIGILAYAWVATPLAVSVFSTACLGVCFLAGVVAVW